MFLKPPLSLPPPFPSAPACNASQIPAFAVSLQLDGSLSGHWEERLPPQEQAGAHGAPYRPQSPSISVFSSSTENGLRCGQSPLVSDPLGLASQHLPLHSSYTTYYSSSDWKSVW